MYSLHSQLFRYDYSFLHTDFDLTLNAVRTSKCPRRRKPACHRRDYTAKLSSYGLLVREIITMVTSLLYSLKDVREVKF